MVAKRVTTAAGVDLSVEIAGVGAPLILVAGGGRDPFDVGSDPAGRI
ncbi:hypothetical protein [Nocardia sp. BMG111209]|nr:hypothetical protein [Nocardia sp. BMG111209]